MSLVTKYETIRRIFERYSKEKPRSQPASLRKGAKHARTLRDFQLRSALLSSST